MSLLVGPEDIPDDAATHHDASSPSAPGIGRSVHERRHDARWELAALHRA
ncbi:hypothetical protein A176_001219 [Myxococcus hansupus]|uniref:Uncharacterized protein n=1 Tax=Pseudomyxococcus hansupus TaxID=1297742 RepID=A0A0H4X8W5_9BACT|nr:hypothetical protein A176_001219 [Myxococcus hansupus]